MSVDEVLAQLRGAKDRLGHAKTAGTAAIQAINEALQHVNHALPRDSMVARQVEALRQELENAVGRNNHALPRIDKAIADLQQLGDVGGSSGGAPPPPPVPPAPPASEPDDDEPNGADPPTVPAVVAPPAPAPRVPPQQRWPGYPASRTLSWSARLHIVYGDDDNPNSGGHLHGTGRPGKTEFPPGWDEDKIADEAASVADDPDEVYALPKGGWQAVGVRDGVTIEVIVRPNGRIATGYPVSGPGVRRNPRRRHGV